MRITYFNYLWDIDGISAGSAIKGKELVRALRELGHEVTLHWRTPQPTPGEALKMQTRNSFRKKVGKYLRGPKQILKNARHLIEEQRIIQQENPDILMSRLEFASFSAALLAKGNQIPFVLEVDCPTVWEYKNFAAKHHIHVPWLPEAIEKYNLRAADAIIVISNILRNYLVELGGQPEKMVVIPNGADPRRFEPRPPDGELEQRYHTKGHVVLGWIGALHGWSGLENLIEVAKELLTVRSTVCFMFVTGRQNQIMIEQAFSAHPLRRKVVLPGSVPHEDIPRYLSLMDIVFAPYPKRDFWYPSSMKIFEYMSAGKAVMATDVGQVGEVIRDGDNGILFDPMQREDTVKKILRLVDEPELRKKLGCRARETVEKYYSWERHACRLEQVFLEALGKKYISKNRHGERAYASKKCSAKVNSTRAFP